MIKFCYSVCVTYLKFKINNNNIDDNIECMAMDITASLFKEIGSKSFISQIDERLELVEKEYLILNEIKNRVDKKLIEV